jgi:hypothetical protein
MVSRTRPPSIAARLSIHRMNRSEAAYGNEVMADALVEQPIVISLTRARTYRVNGVPTTRDPAAPPEAAAAPEGASHPDELRARPTPYERLVADMERLRDEAMRLGKDPREIEEEGLEVRFRGGMLQISGEALALSRMPPDVHDEEDTDPTPIAATDTQDDAFDNVETGTDSSLNGGYIAPDLGERVL